MVNYRWNVLKIIKALIEAFQRIELILANNSKPINLPGFYIVVNILCPRAKY